SQHLPPRQAGTSIAAPAAIRTAISRARCRSGSGPLSLVSIWTPLPPPASPAWLPLSSSLPPLLTPRSPAASVTQAPSASKPPALRQATAGVALTRPGCSQHSTRRRGAVADPLDIRDGRPCPVLIH